MDNIAAGPEVSNVRVKKLFSDSYSGEGEYFGGHEGGSLFSWYRDNDGTIDLIAGANSKTYEVTESDYNCRILFGYVSIVVSPSSFDKHPFALIIPLACMYLWPFWFTLLNVLVLSLICERIF